jgi:hypothetical protein
VGGENVATDMTLKLSGRRWIESAQSLRQIAIVELVIMPFPTSYNLNFEETTQPIIMTHLTQIYNDSPTPTPHLPWWISAIGPRRRGHQLETGTKSIHYRVKLL